MWYDISDTHRDRYGRYSTNTDNSFFALFHLLILLPPDILFKEKQYHLFVFFSGLQAHFSSMLAPKEESWRN